MARGARGMREVLYSTQRPRLLQGLQCEDRTFSQEAVSLATPEMPPVFGGE